MSFAIIDETIPLLAVRILAGAEKVAKEIGQFYSEHREGISQTAKFVGKTALKTATRAFTGADFPDPDADAPGE